MQRRHPYSRRGVLRKTVLRLGARRAVVGFSRTTSEGGDSTVRGFGLNHNTNKGCGRTESVGHTVLAMSRDTRRPPMHMPAVKAAASSEHVSPENALTSPENALASGRLIVELLKFHGAWISRPVGGSNDDDVYYVRQSSMRNKSEWTSLRAGCRVSFVMKRAAGRAIVSDATIESA